MTTKKITKVKKFTIKTKDWLRGMKSHGHACKQSALKVHDSYCCLGFYMKACGFSEKDIYHRRDPLTLLNGFSNKKAAQKKIDQAGAGWLLNSTFLGELYLSLVCSSLMEINDRPLIAEGDRRLRIKEIFAEHNVEVIFDDD